MKKKTTSGMLFCRVSTEDRALVDKACAKRQAEIPDGLFTAGLVMRRLILTWARNVLATPTEPK